MSSADVRQKVFRVPSSIVLSVGLSWDYIGATPVDLDLSAVCFTKEGQLLDTVFFNHLFPEGTDEAALRADFLVDPALLPYMFLSGDSTVGGEEENQLSGINLAARRRRNLLSSRPRRGGRQSATAAAESLFNRLYEEDELTAVQEAVEGYYAHGGEITDENGVLVARAARREVCDEVITFVPQRIPRDAEVIFLSVSSYTGQDFTALSTAKLVIYNETTNERVGTIDLKATTGSGTANLAAMFLRVPAADDDHHTTHDSGAGCCWDLRELNVRSFGYTFVDALPLMLDVLGVPKHSRPDTVSGIPDYPLTKRRAQLAEQPLSDVRFGLGWDGEHDLDAFMVLLDEQNNYVDHVYPKHGKLRSTVAADMARHSGDALTGMNTTGDEEFIDLLTYRVPSNVRTILVGCTYVESFGASKDSCKTIYDIPNCYMRLQNRTLENPQSFEVDRWDVRKDYKRERQRQQQQQDGGKKGAKKKAETKTTYKAADKSTQPVRALLMGVMVKKSTIPFEELFPDGRRIDHAFRREDSVARGGGDASSYRTVLEAELDDEVPLFEFLPLHQYIPVDPRSGGISAVIPLLQGVSAFLCGTSSVDGNTDNNQRGGGGGDSSLLGRSGGGTSRSQTCDHVLDRENNLPGWDHTTTVAVGGKGAIGDAYGGIWEQMQKRESLAECFAIEVRFVEVLALEPRMPGRFKCHGESWVCGQSDTITGGAGGLNRPLKTPFLVNRDRMAWDKSASAAAAVFIVRKYDRIRVVLYEYAAFGYADIDLMQMTELWQGEGRPVECSVALQGGGHLGRGEVKVRLTRASYRQSKRTLGKQADRAEEKRQARSAEVKNAREAEHNDGYCLVM